MCGAHISENLEHHKRADVTRILEDKGFKKSTDEATVSIYSRPGVTDNGQRTIIVFDDHQFVHPQEPVKFYESATGKDA
jgi:hypothetical protein